MTKEQNIPALRFPEFQESWQSKKIKDILTVKYGKDYKHLSEGKIPLLGSGGVMGHVDDSLYDKPSVLIGRKGSIDSPLFMDEPFWTVDTMFYSHINDTYLPYFVYQIVKRVNWLRYNEATGVPSLNTTSIHNVKINVPHEKEEQEKIAAFLRAVDERIAQLSKKKDLLEVYKKGLMQKVFKQEIRFKDDNGKPFPDWKERPLEKITDRVTEKNTDDAINYVLTNSATQGVVSQQDYFEKDIANQENLQGYYVVRKDDFVYNPRVSSTAPVGPIKRNHLSIGVMSPLYSVFRFTEGDLDFYERYFETSLWHRYLHSVANIGARHDRMNITTSDFQKMPMPFPHPNEQKKIAEFLGAVDKKINLVADELDGAQAFKKGLLQQMFV